jgi:hypothetical protein
MIFGPVCDTRKNEWRRKFNKELQEELGLAPVTSYIKGQRMQWLGHIMRRSEEKLSEQLWSGNRKGKGHGVDQGRGGWTR